MSKLTLEIETNNPEITRGILNDFMTKKGGFLKYIGFFEGGDLGVDLLKDNDITSFIWLDEKNDLPRGKRKYYSSNRLSENKITMDATEYTNPELTRFECCICLKVKHVSQLLIDYLGRCIDCKLR